MSDFKFKNETCFEFGEGFSEGFTVVPNNILNDSRLSFKSLGIYVQIVQYQNSKEHKIYMSGLENLKTDKESSVRSGVSELIKYGYIERLTIRNERGQMKGYRYIVHVKPIASTNFEPERDNQVLDKLVPDNLEHINKIGYKENKKKENKEDEEEASRKILNFYYNDYQLSKKKMPHIKKLITDNADKFDLDLWNEIFISASSDNIENKYKYVRAILEDLDSKGIYTLIAYNEKKADQKKSANNPNNSILPKGKKDTKQNIPNLPKVKTRFHNINSTFDKYTPEQLEGILQESQKDKFPPTSKQENKVAEDTNPNEMVWVYENN